MSDNENAGRCKTLFHFAGLPNCIAKVDGNWLEATGEKCERRFQIFTSDDTPQTLINMDQVALVEVVYE